ncbi:MAG: DUF1801 domain-containing protein [Flavobacteriales bacterium]|nr:DUF1801 domain-containing protein [Flavobacteriales bacterium]
MAENKTQKTKIDAAGFLNTIENDQRRSDAQTVMRWMEEITGWKPDMWGPSIIGFGNYHYTYESGREGDFFKVGLSPRKQSLTVYIMPGFSRYDELMGKLGKHTTGKSCLYIKKLTDIDEEVLKELIRQSVEHMNSKYPE